MFPLEYQELQKELSTGLHPRLYPILAQHGADDLDMKLAQIAAYCEVALDGVYTLDERRKLCDILRERLVLLRERPPETQHIILQ